MALGCYIGSSILSVYLFIACALPLRLYMAHPFFLGHVLLVSLLIHSCGW